MGPDSEELKHLRLHNGTIWRWNRPLIGFSPDGTPHIRIEHRPPSAGPSIIDTIANAAFYFGLSKYLFDMLQNSPPPLSFADAKDNFYQAARYGLDSHVTWFDGSHHRLHALLEKELIPMAYQGLQSLHISAQDTEQYLSIISQRVAAQQTGSGNVRLSPNTVRTIPVWRSFIYIINSKVYQLAHGRYDYIAT